MNNQNYRNCLSLFVKKIKELKNPSFVKPEEWKLCHDLQNGVSVVASITDESDRKLLHKIGQQYGLIPLCPNEVVDLDFSKDGEINFAVVETIFGRLKIEPKKVNK
ncbi:hypothetical protein JWG39_15650 [Desulforhopalus vacuolatus]|uniref:hypothetical protein n=1 Tax=Desulforhopalus vacuolatus TaxID=40414 RepID=UPI0019653E6D|nr:hypothetical protein [Desulforhopalus vacuolatus]MBM9521254.1 hypothetical protein [Desulforhopalus vacuolatus]